MVLTHKFTIQLDKALSIGLIMCIVNLCVNTIMRPTDRALYNYCQLMC
jgi:hypothetical protein